ncbi:hypothetical protein E2562_031662, partial [Oryza meyeriana var. granulata]
TPRSAHHDIGSKSVRPVLAVSEYGVSGGGWMAWSASRGSATAPSGGVLWVGSRRPPHRHDVALGALCGCGGGPRPTADAQPIYPAGGACRARSDATGATTCGPSWSMPSTQPGCQMWMRTAGNGPPESNEEEDISLLARDLGGRGGAGVQSSVLSRWLSNSTILPSVYG